jgi:hypothetical protein
MQFFKRMLLISTILIPVIGSAQKLDNMKANQWYPISGLNAAKYISSLPGSEEQIADDTKGDFDSYIGEKFKMKPKIGHYEYAYPQLVRFCNDDIKDKCIAPTESEVKNDSRYSRAKAYLEHRGGSSKDLFGYYFLSANMVPFLWDLTYFPEYTPERAYKGLYKFTDKMQVMYTKDSVHFTNSEKETLSIKVDRKKNHIAFTEKGRKYAFSNSHEQRNIPRPLQEASAGFTLAVLILLELF